MRNVLAAALCISMVTGVAAQERKKKAPAAVETPPEQSTCQCPIPKGWTLLSCELRERAPGKDEPRDPNSIPEKVTVAFHADGNILIDGIKRGGLVSHASIWAAEVSSNGRADWTVSRLTGVMTSTGGWYKDDTKKEFRHGYSKVGACAVSDRKF